jgi:hypothetical protein
VVEGGEVGGLGVGEVGVEEEEEVEGEVMG